MNFVLLLLLGSYTMISMSRSLQRAIMWIVLPYLSVSPASDAGVRVSEKGMLKYGGSQKSKILG